MPKVSIVVPIYKVPFEFLDQCISSIVNQTEREIEIILVDDGSPKEWADKCEYYANKDKRIKVIHKENGGVSKARNRGLLEATSEWITFVDGDDWIDLNFIETALKNIKSQNEGTQSDILIYSGYRNYYNREVVCEPHFKNETIFKTNKDKDELQSGCLINYTWKGRNTKGLLISSTCGRIFKRDFLIRNELYQKNTPYAEDCIYFLETTEKANRIIYYDQPVYHYRSNPDSAVNKFRANAIEEHLTYLNYISAFAQENKKSDSFRNMINYRVFTSMYNLIKQNFYNPQNNVSSFKKWINTKNCFKQEPFKSALKNINPHLLRKNALIKYYLIKYKFYPLLEMGRKYNNKSI